MTARTLMQVSDFITHCTGPRRTTDHTAHDRFRHQVRLRDCNSRVCNTWSRIWRRLSEQNLAETVSEQHDKVLSERDDGILQGKVALRLCGIVREELEVQGERHHRKLTLAPHKQATVPQAFRY